MIIYKIYFITGKSNWSFDDASLDRMPRLARLLLVLLD